MNERPEKKTISFRSKEIQACKWRIVCACFNRCTACNVLIGKIPEHMPGAKSKHEHLKDGTTFCMVF